MVADRAKPSKLGGFVRFAAFLAGEAVLVAAFVALARSPHDLSVAYAAKLIGIEAAAVVFALVMEYRPDGPARKVR
jgi:hypothetical protein